MFFTLETINRLYSLRPGVAPTCFYGAIEMIDNLVEDLKDIYVGAVDVCIKQKEIDELRAVRGDLGAIEEIDGELFDFLDEVYHRTSSREFNKLRFIAWEEEDIITDVIYASELIYGARQAASCGGKVKRRHRAA